VPTGLPTTVFLNAEHREVARITGSATVIELDAALRKTAS
jgi:hypothetical protein